MDLRSRLASVTVAAVAALGAGVATATPAAADWPYFHGDVYNVSASDRNILASGDWSTQDLIQTLRPGQACSYHDCDGYHVPYGCYADVNVNGGEYWQRSYGGWHKITDAMNVSVDVHC